MKMSSNLLKFPLNDRYHGICIINGFSPKLMNDRMKTEVQYNRDRIQSFNVQLKTRDLSYSTVYFGRMQVCPGVGFINLFSGLKPTPNLGVNHRIDTTPVKIDLVKFINNICTARPRPPSPRPRKVFFCVFFPAQRPLTKTWWTHLDERINQLPLSRCQQG